MGKQASSVALFAVLFDVSTYKPMNKTAVLLLIWPVSNE